MMGPLDIIAQDDEKRDQDMADAINGCLARDGYARLFREVGRLYGRPPLWQRLRQVSERIRKRI